MSRVPVFGRRGAFAVCALVAGLAAAACSSPAPSRSVASLPSRGGATPTTAAPSVAARDASLIAYTRCLRRHGIDEPDPYQRAGYVGLSIAVPPQSPAFTRADAECGHVLSHLIQQKEGHQLNTARTMNLDALTNYARCMRSHDIAMLDPNAYGALDLGNVPGITNDFGRYTPQFAAADSACGHLLPAGTHDDGTGP